MTDGVTTDWCAGCDQIKLRKQMAWEDGRYRCDRCLHPPRGVAAGPSIRVDLHWILTGEGAPRG